MRCPSKLVRVAKRMSGGLKAPWTAIYIENERHYRLSREGQEAVERTLRLAERMGGKTEIIQGQKALRKMCLAYARANGITKVIIGKSHKARWREILMGTLADQIIRHSSDIDVYVVTGDAEDRKSFNTPFWKTRTHWPSYLSAPIMTAFCTVVILPVRPYLEPVNLVMVYLIGIVSVALRYGRGPSLLATLLSAICVNFFFMVPYYSLKISEQQHVLTFMVMLLTGMIIGTQTSRLRLQAISARRREKNTAILFAMSRELTANRGKVTLAQIAAQHMAEVLDSDIFIWLPDEKTSCRRSSPKPRMIRRLSIRCAEESVARWAFTPPDRMPGSAPIRYPAPRRSIFRLPVPAA